MVLDSVRRAAALSWPGSEIAFSQVREDPLVEEAVVRDAAQRSGAPVRVLLVASGGCTALSLLRLPEVAHIDLLDPNPAQLHLVELQAKALELGGHDLLMTVLSGERRGADLGWELVRGMCSEPARTWWDDRPEQLAFGLKRVGRFEELFRELARTARAAGIGLFSGELPPAFDAVVAQVFEREKLASTFSRAAVDYSMDRGFDTHFAQVIRAAAARWKPGQNYFLEQVLRDDYGPPTAGLPGFMESDAAQAIVTAGGFGRLTLHQGLFTDVMRRLDGQWGLIQTSNISDWVPIPELVSLLAEVGTRLEPGGAWIGRRLNGDHSLMDTASAALDVDRELSAQLHASDRSFFYSELVVGRTR